MSVQCNTYIVLGVKLPYEKHGMYERFEDLMDSAYDKKREGLTCIFDGMSGKHVILGHVIAKSDNHEGFDEPITVDPTPTDIWNVIQDLMKYKINENPKIIIVSHCR